MTNRELKTISEGSWAETLLTPEKKALVDALFPFRNPPLEIASNTLLIEDPSLQLREGFHQTQSFIFLFPRNDENLLVPIVAFDESYPSLSLWVLISETMPATYEGNNRRWAVWMGKAVLENLSNLNRVTQSDTLMTGYTHQRALTYLRRAEEIKKIYSDALEGKNIELDRISELTRYFVLGDWYSYYTQRLPRIISEDKEAGEKIVKKLFEGLEANLSRAGDIYEGLSAEDKLLLNNSFPLIVKARFDSPFIYFSKEVEAVRKKEIDEMSKLPTRDPLEIIGRTQGISHKEVERIFIPDEVFETPVGRIVVNRIRQMNLYDKVSMYSDLEAEDPFMYENCNLRYINFHAGKLVEFIQNGRLVPLLPSEW